MSDVFISYSRKDIAFARLIWESLKQSQIEPWIDWERIGIGQEFWTEIREAIENANAFLFIISKNSIGSPYCKGEIELALKNHKRIIPILVDDLKPDAIKEFSPDLPQINWIIFKRDRIFRIEENSQLRSDKPEDSQVALPLPPHFEEAMGKLGQAIHTDWEWVKCHTQLQVDALRWENNQHKPGYLAHGAELEESEQQLLRASGKDPQATNLQLEYVTASRKEETLRQQEQLRLEQKARGRQRLALWAVGIGLVVAIVLGELAWVQRNRAVEQAQIALSRQFAAQAQPIFASGNSKLVTAVLLAIQSMRMFPTGEAAQILQNNSLADPIASMPYDGDPRYLPSVAFSPDGKYVVAASVDNTARVWDAATGQEIARMTHEGKVTTVAFSSDGKYVVSGSYDCTARVWETATGKQIARMTHPNVVGSVAFSPDGRYVVSGSVDGTAIIWEATTGREISRVKHNNDVRSVAFSPDGKYVVSGIFDRTASVWEAATGKVIASDTHLGDGISVAFSPDSKYVVSGSTVWKATTGQVIFQLGLIGNQYTIGDVNSVAFSSDGKYVITGSYPGIAVVFDAFTGIEVARMTHDGSVMSVAFSPDGKYVASGSMDGTARVWEAATGTEIARMTHGGAVYSLAFSPDGKYVVSGSADGTARVWKVLGSEIARMAPAGAVTSVAFSPDGKYVASGSEWDGTARVWEAITGQEITRVSYNGPVYAIAFSRDGKYVVSGGCDQRVSSQISSNLCSAGSARVWEASTGIEIARMTYNNFVTSVAFSPDSKYVVSGGYDLLDPNQYRTQGSARVWVATTGQEIFRIKYDYGVTSVAFSPDGKFVASGGCDQLQPDRTCLQGSARVWEVATGKEIARMTHAYGVGCVDFSPDGKYIASSDGYGGKTVRVWEATTGREIARMTHDSYISSVAFSPDGKYVVSGSGDGTARVWVATTGQEIARMTHDDYVTSVAFSPDGKYVVSGSYDNTARVWEAATGKEIARMTHDGTVNSVAFSPDGKYVVSVSADHTVRVWIYRPEDLIAEACSRVTRNLTRAEWTQYIGDALPYQAVCLGLPVEP